MSRRRVIRGRRPRRPLLSAPEGHRARGITVWARMSTRTTRSWGSRSAS